MLNGKVALVTGSNAGIGAAIVKELSSRGASVVVNYPFPNVKHEAEELINSLGTTCIVVEADLSTIHGPQKLIDATVDRFGKIDILINNASTTILAPLEKATLEDWDTMLNLNGRAYLLTTQAVLPHLNNPSRIVNIISVGARAPTVSSTIYAATKGMQDVFTKLWARELPPKYGCTVNSVSPGATRTAPMEELLANPDSVGYRGVSAMLDQTPSGRRLGEPREVAYAVAMLCEDEAGWMNGNHIHVNGGIYQG